MNGERTSKFMPEKIYQKNTPPMIWGFPAVHLFTSWDCLPDNPSEFDASKKVNPDTQLPPKTRCVQRSFLAPCLSPVTRPGLEHL